ncbi:MAG: nitrous oxide reductase family maturation protein NosD [Chitinophagales bacterium]|nr:nitrous oxide reductase family maturation protein NosD [Chitinophagales bacterium]
MPRLIITILFIFFAYNGNAKTIVVRADKANAIKNALAYCTDGDTVSIEKGLYKEQDILVSKRITILGKDYPVIDGVKKGQLIVVVRDSVIISGLQLQNTGRSSMTDMAAIRLQNVKSVSVINNKLVNNTYGVYLQNSHYCLVYKNTIRADAQDELNSGNGIHAWKSTHLLLQSNNISGHRDGIYFEFVTDSRILNNTSTENIRYGLHFMFSHKDVYTRNSFINNGSGVAVMYSKQVEMYYNTFRHNWGDASYAILLKEIADSKIEHNLFDKNTVGIYMEGTSRIQVLYNEFVENGWAMRVQSSCDNNVFEKNNFLSNSFDVATNGTMMLNTFNNNYWDKYDGYDLDKNKVGDVPYYPVSMYSVVTERVPTAMILYRSFLTDIMNRVEKVMPSIVPDKLKDDNPLMKSLKLR